MSGPDADDAGGRLFEEQREALSRPVLRLFTEYGRDHRLLVAVGLVGTVVGPLLALLPTYVLKVTIDGALLQTTPYAYPFVPASLIPDSRWHQIVTSAGVVVGATAINAVLTRYSTLAWDLFAQEVQHDLRTRTFAEMQRLDVAFFTSQRTGQLLSVLNSDVNQLEQLLRDLVRSLIDVGVRVVGIAAILLALNWQLALVSLLPVPVLALLSYWYSTRVSEHYANVRQRVGNLTSLIDNNLDGITTVKLYTNEAHERDRVEDASREYLGAKWDAALVRSKLFPSMRIVNRTGFGVILLVGGYWLVAGPPPLFTGTLQVGTLVAFLSYNQQFTTPLVQGGRLLDTYFEARASVERIFALLDYPVAVRDADDGVVLDRVEGRVEYQHVDFGYDEDDPVLRDVDLAVEPGETLGIVGPTGTGKTTLVKLLARFYDPDRGTVRLDGHDLRDVDLRSLRGTIGYVGQEPFLFDGTVRENVAYADPDATDSAIRAAAKRAGAHEFVRDLPDGYDAQVGERGVRLSGGQRQRLAIARAILRDPEILVLDEATSHVDNETEALIQANLRELAADRTTFVVAHRLSTVRNADQIVVLDDGEIAERGSHEALLSEDGIYANLWRVQVGAFDGHPADLRGRNR